jgi:hypothetical protein
VLTATSSSQAQVKLKGRDLRGGVDAAARDVGGGKKQVVFDGQGDVVSGGETEVVLTEQLGGFVGVVGDVEVAVAGTADADEVASLRKGAHRVSVGRVSAIGLDRGRNGRGKKSVRKLSLGTDDVLRDRADQGAVDVEPVKAKRRAKRSNDRSGRGNGVDFEDAFGPGTDLTYDVSDKAVKESIVLRRAPKEAPRIRYQLKTNGLLPRLKDGGYELIDQAGEVVFTLPRAFMVDARGGVNMPNNAVRYVEQRIYFESDGTFLELLPSFAWLNDTDRVYPVTIDPTILVGHGPL